MKSLHKVDIRKILEILPELKKHSNSSDYMKMITSKHRVSKNFPFESGGYQYIPLTTFSSSPTADDLSETESATRSQFLKLATESGSEHSSALTEGGYGRFCDYISEDIRLLFLNSVSTNLGRVRVAILGPHSRIEEHVDLPLEQGLRIHLPVITNDECHFSVKKNGVYTKMHLPADGHLYFVNTAFPHSVENCGPTERVHVIFNCFDLDLLQHFQEV